MTDDFTAPAVVTPESGTDSAEMSTTQNVISEPVPTVPGVADQTATVPASTDGQPASAVAATEAPAEEAKPAGPSEEEITNALNAFEVVLTQVTTGSAEGHREESTGAIDDDLKGNVQAAFAALPRGNTKASARPRAKDLVDQRLHAAMENMDMPLARTLFTIQQECLTVRGAGAESAGLTVKVDPTEDFVGAVTAHSLAAYALVPSDEVEKDWPSRVEVLVNELAPQVGPYVAWMAADEDTRGDEPETHDLVKRAVKISQGRGTAAARRTRKASSEGGTGTPRAPYAGSKRSVAKHIEEAFAGQPVGTWLSITQIAKFESKEYNGDKVSQGAVSARIYAPGGCTIDGITPRENEDGKKGAVKTA